MIRLFVGAFIPEEIKRHAAHFREKTGTPEGLRWTAPDALHITLKFLGLVPEQNISIIQSVLKDVVPQHEALRLTLQSAGVFPSRSAARIFWMGIKGQVDGLKNLADAIEEGLTPVGYPPENRKFKPHLTVARGSDTDKSVSVMVADQFCTLFSQYQSPEFSINDVHLIQSHLHPRGSRYESLAAFPLRPA